MASVVIGDVYSCSDGRMHRAVLPAIARLLFSESFFVVEADAVFVGKRRTATL